MSFSRSVFQVLPPRKAYLASKCELKDSKTCMFHEDMQLVCFTNGFDQIRFVSHLSHSLAILTAKLLLQTLPLGFFHCFSAGMSNLRQSNEQGRWPDGLLVRKACGKPNRVMSSVWTMAAATFATACCCDESDLGRQNDMTSSVSCLRYNLQHKQNRRVHFARVACFRAGCRMGRISLERRSPWWTSLFSPFGSDFFGLVVTTEECFRQHLCVSMCHL